MARIAGSVTLILGALSLIASILYNSQILAFIGLGLVFWGIILVYIRSEEYVKETLLGASSLSALEALNQIMEKLNCIEKAVYLPPKYLRDPESNKVYIPGGNILRPPSPEQAQGREEALFIKNPDGVILTPPGSELTKLFERTLKTSFTKADIQYLQLNMPKLFIEELEIAQNLDINVEGSKVQVKIENSPYLSLAKEAAKFPKLYESMGCPLSSAIACALAKATGKPVVIEKQQIKERNKTIEIEYRIIEEEKA